MFVNPRSERRYFIHCVYVFSTLASYGRYDLVSMPNIERFIVLGMVSLMLSGNAETTTSSILKEKMPVIKSMAANFKKTASEKQ